MNLALFLYLFVYINEVSGALDAGARKGNEICMCKLPLTSFDLKFIYSVYFTSCVTVSKMKLLFSFLLVVYLRKRR